MEFSLSTFVIVFLCGISAVVIYVALQVLGFFLYAIASSFSYTRWTLNTLSDRTHYMGMKNRHWQVTKFFFKHILDFPVGRITKGSAYWNGPFDHKP